LNIKIINNHLAALIIVSTANLTTITLAARVFTNFESLSCLFLVSILHSSQKTSESFDLGSECLLKQ
jgi:hypothetical protein